MLKNIDDVKRLYNEQNGKLNYLFFWKVDVKRTINESCLSQWYFSNFIVDGILYKSAEQFMMAEKAKLFDDIKTFDLIMDASSQKEIKQLGRSVKGFNEIKWIQERCKIVREGNIHKFEQNLCLQDYLIKTGDKIIVEASPYDNIWGIGYPKENHNVYNPSNWRGLNLLGFILMDVRDEFQKRKLEI